MTTATTILALVPVLTSVGRGADVMVPMAIPSVGGMLVEVLTMLVVPVLYATVHEFRLRTRVPEKWIGVLLVATALVGFFLMALWLAAAEVLDRLRGRRTGPPAPHRDDRCDRPCA